MLPKSEHKFNHDGHRLLAGQVVCNYGQSVTNCIVRRMTERGATIELESLIGIPDQFHLLIPDEGPPLPCKIVWQSEKELGSNSNTSRQQGPAPRSGMAPISATTLTRR
jgi:hypothetical protein